MKFNKLIKDCVKNINEFNSNNKNKHINYKYDTYDNYYKSIKNKLDNFSIPSSVKESINCIIYNNKNNDGLFSAAIVNHYLIDNKGSNISFFGIGQGISNLEKIMNKLKGKIIIILDLEYDFKTYEKLSNICRKIITIDDHKPPCSPINKQIKNTYIFSGNNSNAACAFVWTVFYPNKKIPKTIQMIDVQDSKLFMKGLEYSQFFTSALTFRYKENPKYKNLWNTEKPFQDLWDVIDENNVNFWVILGNYMSEVQENIKEQIARNAQIMIFKNKLLDKEYKVGVLNFLDPVLTNRIGRQICTNLNDQIDFAFLWAYEHNKNLYRIQLISNHSPSFKYNLGDISYKFKHLTDKGGGGHKNIGNFYYPRDKKHDIWDLLEDLKKLKKN